MTRIAFNISEGSKIEAAISSGGTLAGIEIICQEEDVANLRVQNPDGSHLSLRMTEPTIDLAMSPRTMEALVYCLADKLGLPLFKEQEWRDIMHVLNLFASEHVLDSSTHAKTAMSLAHRIEEGLMKR